jgi:hypothetical protein
MTQRLRYPFLKSFKCADVPKLTVLVFRSEDDWSHPRALQTIDFDAVEVALSSGTGQDVTIRASGRFPWSTERWYKLRVPDYAAAEKAPRP